MYRIYLTVRDATRVRECTALAIETGAIHLCSIEGEGGLALDELNQVSNTKLTEIELEYTGDNLEHIVQVLQQKGYLTLDSIHVIPLIDITIFTDMRRQNEALAGQIFDSNHKIVVFTPAHDIAEAVLIATENTGAGRVDPYYGCGFTAEVYGPDSARGMLVRSELRCQGVDLSKAIKVIREIDGAQVGVFRLEEHPTTRCKIRVTLPLPNLEIIKATALSAGAEAYFHYRGEGRWTSGPDSEPYIGEKGKSSRVKLLMIQFTCSDPNQVPRIVDAIKKEHPFQTPVIDVFQMNVPVSAHK